VKNCSENTNKMVLEYNKSLSNTSTSSVESGFFEMESSEQKEKVKKMNIGEAVKEVLVAAKAQSRIICGLKSVTKHLNETENPEDSLFFFIVQSGDHTTNMSSILLKAFCFENDIYIIQLDSEHKLSRILCEQSNCALVQRSAVCTNSEDVLIDHCEDFWHELVQPIIRLPEK
jgi:ribosomal protein L7Ae-like RNA K-turn-binding protein